MMTSNREYCRRFRSMGCDVSVTLVCDDGAAADGALDAVEGLFGSADRRFSRFRPDSELSVLNRSRVLRNPSAAMLDLLARSLRWERLTGRLFNPLVLMPLVSAGYDRDFRESASFVSRGQIPVRSIPSLASQLEIDASGQRHRVALNGDESLDLGGIVKGWAVDRAVSFLEGFPGCLVDAGGDLRAGGRPVSGSWHVAIEDPLSPAHDREIIELGSCAVATSGSYRRAWVAGGRRQHHLIDPATGAPSDTDVLAATVISGSAEEAEVVAKACVIGGSDYAAQFLERGNSARGAVTVCDGRRIASDGWESAVRFGPGRYRVMGATG
jgi:thiamine biosynthesis lipoprotein